MLFRSEEAKIQDEAVAAARQSLELALNQYRAGTINFLQVVVSQSTALTNLRTQSDLQGRRMAASVQLLKALGGDWRAAMLPDYPEIRRAAER